MEVSYFLQVMIFLSCHVGQTEHVCRWDSAPRPQVRPQVFTGLGVTPGVLLRRSWGAGQGSLSSSPRPLKGSPRAGR